MSASCVACRTRGSGMVAIYQHPNGLDQMFTSVTGIEVEDNDHLCIPCYDDLKAAHLFKQKCIQNNILRVSQPSPGRSVATDSNRVSVGSNDDMQKQSDSKELVPTAEISTTSVDGADILEEHLDIPSETEESEQQDDTEDEELDVPKAELLEPSDSLEISGAQPSSELAPLEQISDDTVTNEMQSVVKLEPLCCDDCGKAFSKRSLLQRHTKICHLAGTESTDDGEQQLLASGALAYLPAVHSLMCEYCFQEFSDLPAKLVHEAEHLAELKPYKCPQCQASFKEKVGLRSHIRIHSSVKRYKCQYCDMRFHQRGNVTAHERTHVGAKPYVCPQCGKGFAEGGNLKNHIRYHTGERPYACSECPKRFRTHYSRTIHLRSHSNERPFRCVQCDKGFYSSGKLIIHQRVHSGEKPYRCGKCPAKFADSSGLKRHSKTH